MIRLIRLALGHARRRKALSIVALALSGIMGAAIISLIGNATRRSDELLTSLRDPKARSIVLRSTQDDSRIPRNAAAAIASLPGVELAVGLPSAVSVTTPGLADPNASTGYILVDLLDGELPITYTRGRPPAPGEVALSPGAVAALRMTDPLATSIAANEDLLPIVGTFTLAETGAISSLFERSVVGPATVKSDFIVLAILAREPADIATIVSAINRFIIGRDSIGLDYEQRAADVQQTVADAGQRNVASLAIGVVMAGALIQLASALLNTLLQRRENARRRALGFTRLDIIAIGGIEAAALAAIGASLGIALATLRLASQGATIDVGRSGATVGLLVAIAALASLPGGATAALQDPARILRVP